MNSFIREQVIFDGVGVLQAVFTAAVTNIITSNAHGYTGGECLQFTTATTLPAGLSLATNYYVLRSSITTNTFKVSATPDGTEVDITDTGTGTHTMHLKGKVIMCEGFNNVQVAVNSSGTSTLTVKFQTSDAQTPPDFNAAQSITNRWDYCDLVDLEDKSSIDGDTGLALAGTDDHRQFEANFNSKRWISAVITAWTQGVIRVGVKLNSTC